MGNPDDQDTGFYEALGRTIQVLRTDRELDRRELARRSGISYSHLTAIENGTRRASPTVLQALAKALGLHSSELLASAETRHARGTGLVSEAMESRAPRSMPPARARATRRDPFWLRQGPEPARISPPAGGEAERQPAPSTPATHSALGFRLAIEALLPHLGAEDLEVLLALAQRLAEPEHLST